MPSTTTDTTFRIHDILRAVSSALEVSVVVVLIVFLLAAAVLTGWAVAEYFTERRHLKAALPALLESLRTTDDRAAVIEGSGLLRRQKDALLELLRHPLTARCAKRSLSAFWSRSRTAMTGSSGSASFWRALRRCSACSARSSRSDPASSPSVRATPTRFQRLF